MTSSTASTSDLPTAFALVIAERSLSSETKVSPKTPIELRHMPSEGVETIRCPSNPVLGSSVISKRMFGKARKAEAIFADKSGAPIQDISLRTVLGATGWSSQSRLT
jgi:hypothetical protein